MELKNNIHSFTENTTKKIAKFDGKFTQGNAVYLADNISCALMAQPVWNVGGFSNLYLVIELPKQFPLDSINSIAQDNLNIQ